MTTKATASGPVHEHDCDRCIFIASYPLRHPYVDSDDGWRTGEPNKVVTEADVYFVCDATFYKYLVRYGKYGEYATTNVPSRYCLAPMIDGIDPYEG